MTVTRAAVRSGVEVSLDAAELAVLELLLSDVLAPVTGYLGAEDHAAVTAAGRLRDGTVFPLPVSLRVPDEVAVALTAGDRLILHDPEGTPVAEVAVSDVFFDREWARVGGPVTRLRPIEHSDGLTLRRSPGQVARMLRGRGWPRTLGVPLHHPLSHDTVAELRQHAAVLDAGLLLCAIDTPRTGPARSAWLQQLTDLEDDLADTAVVTLVPPLPALPGCRAATLDALVLRNLGATHVALATAPTQLPANVEPVRWSPAPAPTAALPSTPADRQGLVVLFTGLSGSGKSTLARALTADLERAGRTVTLLDGDVVRQHLSSGLGFSAEDRATNVRRIGWVAAEIARHGGVAVCAPIAPHDGVRRQVRAMATAVGARFVLVHVATPLEECERRDRKGLYAKARAGHLTGFTGVDDPYEPPSDAEVVIDTAGLSVEACLGRLVEALG